MLRMSRRVPLRWIVIGVFLLSSSLNYLDRQLLAALAPTLKLEFHLNNAQYGQIQSVFFIVYALIAPFAGWFIDVAGLTVGSSIAVTVWSLAGAATAALTSFPGLLACRTVLGAAEAAGIPSAGKANAVYLEPREFAFGSAVNQISITLGSVAAPLVVVAMTPRWGWRSSFALCGALGLLWVPLWWFVGSRLQPTTGASAPARPARRTGTSAILRDPRLWSMALANALVMTTYALWTNWSTVYFVHERGLTEAQANQHFVWIPPVFAGAGGLVGGWLAYRWIRGGISAIAARMRVAWISAAVLLATAAVPFMPTDTLAAAAISLSFFWTLTLSTNIYPLPIDVFGPGHAAFGVAMLTCAYGLMQTGISPLIGAIVDRAGFTPVCVGIAALPLAGVWLLQSTLAGEAPTREVPAPAVL
jgi:ACS family hexuronate transporter-like MFS transporter